MLINITTIINFGIVFEGSLNFSYILQTKKERNAKC